MMARLYRTSSLSPLSEVDLVDYTGPSLFVEGVHLFSALCKGLLSTGEGLSFIAVFKSLICTLPMSHGNMVQCDCACVMNAWPGRCSFTIHTSLQGVGLALFVTITNPYHAKCSSSLSHWKGSSNSKELFRATQALTCNIRSEHMTESIS